MNTPILYINFVLDKRFRAIVNDGYDVDTVIKNISLVDPTLKFIELSSLIKNKNYSDIKNGIKLGDFNVGYANNIYTFPYFCAFMMKAFVKKLE